RADRQPGCARRRERDRQAVLRGGVRPAQRLAPCDDVRGPCATRRGAVALPPVRRDRLDLAGRGALPHAGGNGAARAGLGVPDQAAGDPRRREHVADRRARRRRALHARREPVGRLPGGGHERPVRHRGVVVSAVGSARVGAAIRGEFPIFEHTTYVNSCSQGALSQRVRRAYEECLEGWDANGAEWGHWVERAEVARVAFARLLHADPSEVAVTTSVTQGVNGIVSALPLERGERTRIVISEYEFPTVGQI